MNKIIAISGLKNSGKTTVANMVAFLLNSPSWLKNYWSFKHLPQLNKRWNTVAFADTMKQMLADLLGVDKEKFEDRDFKENTFIDLNELRMTISPSNTLSDNKFVKLVKTLDPEIKTSSLTVRQLMQMFGSNVMRQFFGDKIWINSTLNNIRQNTIISDLRFIIEEEAVHTTGGRIIYVNRPGIEPGNHASEKEVIKLLTKNKFDAIIDNDSTEKELFYKVKNVLKQFNLL